MGGEVEVGGVCSLILEENVEEINLNYKDKASLESGSGNGFTGKGSTGSRHYGFCFYVFFFFVPARFIFLLFSSSEDEGATLLFPLRLASQSLIRWKASWSG